ncbi:hypothetical protein ACJX0J_016278, partial [Zea mays]
VHLLLVLPGNEVGIVVGGGHAGCEAALASPRLGARTLLLTLNIDRIPWQPCNPAVGGPATSQLVHEVDALGGKIGKITDRCYLQKRVLNSSKGPAICALRAQPDKREYAIEMKNSVESTENLFIREAMATEHQNIHECTLLWSTLLICQLVLVQICIYLAVNCVEFLDSFMLLGVRR